LLSRRAFLAAALPLLVACGAGTRRPTPASQGPPIIGPDVAALRVGQEVRVRMIVECVDVGNRVQPTCLRPDCYYEGFLFRICVPSELIAQFEAAALGPIEERLLLRLVDVTGVVQKNGQWSEIVLSAPSQLRVASGLTPPIEPTRVPTPAAATPPAKSG
jgi:hypothetical protein